MNNNFFLDFEGMNDNASETAVKSDKQKITELLELLSSKNQLLQQAASDMDILKTKFREIFEEKSDAALANSTKRVTATNCVGSVPLQQDEGYFQTYSHYGIHHDMLSVSFSSVFLFPSRISQMNHFKHLFEILYVCRMKLERVAIETPFLRTLMCLAIKLS